MRGPGWACSAAPAPRRFALAPALALLRCFIMLSALTSWTVHVPSVWLFYTPWLTQTTPQIAKLGSAADAADAGRVS